MDKTKKEKYFNQHGDLLTELGKLKGYTQLSAMMTELPKFFETIYNDGYTDGFTEGKKAKIENLTKSN
jgi:hypothetical protein